MNKLLPLAIAALALGVGTWLILGAGDDEPAPRDERAQPVERVPAARAPAPVAATPASPPTEPDSDTATSCLDADDLARHPALRPNADALQSQIMGGADFDALLGVEANGLNDLTSQGNSAAMATLAYRSLLSANRQDPDEAAALLNSAEISANGYSPKLAVASRYRDGTALLALQDANYWFYQAALHGRLQALPEYGEIIGAQVGGATGLRWISREQYDALDADGQRLYSPRSVYADVADRLNGAPPRSYPPTVLDAELAGAREAIVERLVAEFRADAAAADIEPPQPILDADAIEAVFAQACPGAIDEFDLQR